MVKQTVLFKNIDEVKDFSALACEKPYDVDVVSGKYLVSAKSIMGIFSLDLTKPVEVVAYDGDERFLSEIERFAYSDEKKKK